MPSVELDAAYIGQEFELLAVGGGTRLRVRVVAALPVDTWAASLAAGATSGGTSPQVSAADELQFLTPGGQLVGAVSSDGDMLVEGRNDGTRGRDLQLYAGDGPPGDGGRVIIQPGSGATNGTIDLFAANGVRQLSVQNTGLAFFSGGPALQPNVVGSRGGNVALTNLLTGLSNMGIIRDSTTP